VWRGADPVGSERGHDQYRLDDRVLLFASEPCRACGIGSVADGPVVPVRAQRKFRVPDLDHAPVQLVAGIEARARLRGQPDIRSSLQQQCPQRAEAVPGGPHPAPPGHEGCRRKPWRHNRARDELYDHYADPLDGALIPPASNSMT
jgi:hypothetical protein